MPESWKQSEVHRSQAVDKVAIWMCRSELIPWADRPGRGYGSCAFVRWRQIRRKGNHSLSVEPDKNEEQTKTHPVTSNHQQARRPALTPFIHHPLRMSASL